jgi:hypothetical protein
VYRVAAETCRSRKFHPVGDSRDEAESEHHPG